jgi:hypothetical protein
VTQPKLKEASAEKTPRVESVSLSDLHPTRRGKHFELMREVLKGLAELSKDSALKVPLGMKTAKELRSAVVRAAATQHMEISSRSDDENLYVWKRHP